MGDSKFDITSTAVEKSIDLVKGFLEKLVGSSIEEAGLIFADNVRLRRFKNQLKIWSEAQKIVESYGINSKQISLKNLVPLLEFSSLEEDDTVQNRWTNLIVNYADADKTYESSIFPWILNQLTSKELSEVEIIFNYQEKDLSFLHIHDISINNLTRLGLIQKVDESPFTRNGVLKVYDFTNILQGDYKLTELGKQFVECCSPRSEK